ncbi:MAG: DUF5658 family protein [Haloarculaceae archaeon]
MCARRRDPPAGQQRLLVDEYWSWVAAALFLLVTVDMLTTVFAAAAVGPGAEINPLMRWALRQGPLALLAVNLAAVVVATLMFSGLLEMVHRTPRPVDRYLAFLVEVWLGLLLAAGLAVLANNLSVVVLGRALL